MRIFLRYIVKTSVDFRRDLTGSFHSDSQISEKDNILNCSFLWLMFSQEFVST